ncbi:hypothetical protein [Rhizobium phaseoli]|uniref:hypothetical protein n=1 Tax=Rhizobium phaseoli TaxID=396 RepID=UPI0025553086|nr:hypothetical protein [Rhizobium phaseoli]MDK4729361.1 hypothetical protein [Rhizobium phaseoli]
MAKSPTQRSREHVARLRRKAQALDKLISTVSLVAGWMPDDALCYALTEAVAEAKKAAEEKSA